MGYEAYPLSTNKDSTRFQFQSIGKRGIFEKVIFITPLTEDIWNLALLDYDPVREEYSDQSTTDNGDLHVVLSTAISSIKIFMNEHENQSIYFTGSTLSRTRLYQIVVAKIHRELLLDFNIYGIKNETAVQFKPNVNFEGFLIQKKH